MVCKCGCDVDPGPKEPAAFIVTTCPKCGNPILHEPEYIRYKIRWTDDEREISHTVPMPTLG